LSSKQNREEALNDFLKRNPGIAKPSARAAWSKIAPKMAAERGIDPNTIRPKRAPKVKVDRRLLHTLDPHPVDINPNYQQQQQGQPGAPPQPGVNWQQGQQGQPGQPQGQPFVQQYTVASVGAFWDALYNFIRLTTPDAPALTDQERTNLGETWIMPFNRYLAGKEKTALAIALLGTLSIFVAKIKPARDAAKKRKEAEDNLDALKKAAREAGKKMPKPDAPKDAPADPAPTPEPDKPLVQKTETGGSFIRMDKNDHEGDD